MRYSIAFIAFFFCFHLNAQEIQIPNGGFELAGSIYGYSKALHPFGWSSNVYEIRNATSKQTVQLKSDSPFEGKYYVSLTQAKTADSVYNPALHLGQMDYSNLLYMYSSGGGIYTPVKDKVKCISGKYRLFKQDSEGVTATVHYYSENTFGKYLAGSLVLSDEIFEWTTFELCGYNPPVEDVATHPHFSVVVLVEGEKYDPAFRLDLDDLQITKTTTISEKPFQPGNSLSIYPNPSKDFLTIKGAPNAPFQWEILNPEGKQILTGTGVTVEIKKLPKGAYQLVVAEQSFSFIKE